MSLITKETAHKLWLAHHEIETSRKLLADIAEQEKHNQETPVTRSQQRSYQLGLPMGSDSRHRLLTVAPELAAQMIRAHIAKKEQELLDFCALAREELDERSDG